MGVESAIFEIIHESIHHDESVLTVSDLCEIAGVSRSGYYRWEATAGQREKREEQGFTQEQLGEASELSSVHISLVENAKRKPSLQSLLQICNALQITMDELLVGNQHLSQNDYQSLSHHRRREFLAKIFYLNNQPHYRLNLYSSHSAELSF